MSFTQEERMQYIGGSDIPAIMGQSRWKTQYRLWAEKREKLKCPTFQPMKVLKWGTALNSL